MNKDLEIQEFLMKDTIKTARENGGLRMIRHLMPHLPVDVANDALKNYAKIVEQEKV